MSRGETHMEIMSKDEFVMLPTASTDILAPRVFGSSLLHSCST